MAAALPAGLLAGCTGDHPGPVPAPTVNGAFIKAAVAKQIPVDDAATAQAEQGSEAFGLALLRGLGADGRSMVYSPQTLVDLLGMLLPGARGLTAADLSKALGTSGLDPDTAAAALGRIDAAARADANQGSNTLEESSDVWSANGLKPSQDYLSALDGAFDTGVHQSDFAHDPAGSQDAINNLVTQETHGYIKKLFSDGSLDASTLLVLTDAVYLNADWAHPFDPENTNTEPFYPASGAAQRGTPQHVDMMEDTDTYAYAEGADWQAVELPYAGGKLVMDVLLPTKGGSALADLRNDLTVGSLNSMLRELMPQQVEVQLPKFTTDSSADGLQQQLSALGLSGLFTHADLGAMFDGGEQAQVSQVVAKAHIAVAEKGTVAAAAAGGGVGASARQVPPTAFVADRPFLYLVRDLTTGQLLFAGQYTGA
jgi:serpin B